MIYQTGSSLKEAIASCQSIRHVNPSMNFDSCTSIFTAIRAAEIQGQATINAGHSTFYAGAFALAAGVISFLAVIYDHRYEKKKNNRKIISQVSSIKEFLRKIEKELDLVGRFIKT